MKNLHKTLIRTPEAEKEGFIQEVMHDPRFEVSYSSLALPYEKNYKNSSSVALDEENIAI